MTTFEEQVIEQLKALQGEVSGLRAEQEEARKPVKTYAQMTTAEKVEYLAEKYGDRA